MCEGVGGRERDRERKGGREREREKEERVRGGGERGVKKIE